MPQTPPLPGKCTPTAPCHCFSEMLSPAGLLPYCTPPPNISALNAFPARQFRAIAPLLRYPTARFASPAALPRLLRATIAIPPFTRRCVFPCFCQLPSSASIPRQASQTIRPPCHQQLTDSPRTAPLSMTLCRITALPGPLSDPLPTFL